MKHLVVCVVCLAFAVAASDAGTIKNGNGVWTLHYSGPHNPEENDCDFALIDCMGQLEVNAPGGPGRYDVYVIATDVTALARTSFGLACNGGMIFNGWTSCADSEAPESGWPGCGKGITLSWVSEQVGPNVTLGVLDVYVYGVSSLCSGPDPRLGAGEFCDGSTPQPACDQLDDSWRFGCVGFGEPGYQSCPAPLPPRDSTWGLIKSLYVD